MNGKLVSQKMNVFVALTEHGPSPSAIAQALDLPIPTVKAIIARDDEMRQVYQDRLREIRDAMRAFKFERTRAAEYLGYSRLELETFIQENPSLAEIVESLRLESADIAEQNLRKALERGEWSATQFTLERSAEGNRRGYGRTQADPIREAQALGVDLTELRQQLVRVLIAGEVVAGKETLGEQDG